EIAGVPIADSRLEQLRANASIEPVLVDDDGTPLAIGKRFSVLSPKIVRAVLLRDHCCQICRRRHRLQIHHLRPRSWGGTDEISDLAAVCSTCHPDLVPHGPYALVGNPNVPGRPAQGPPRRPHPRTTRTDRPPTTESGAGTVT
ncbi:MAG TPA: HNH endonuclease, partial [Acidimicrobiia bacterium]|nr:HNH endonuclease [Acidimicrobiia bacterium]